MPESRGCPRSDACVAIGTPSAGRSATSWRACASGTPACPNRSRPRARTSIRTRCWTRPSSSRAQMSRPRSCRSWTGEVASRGGGAHRRERQGVNAAALDQARATEPVRDVHRFDERALETYLAEHVEGFSGSLTVRQFVGGQSNPTYYLAAGGREYVLRRKPPGKLLPSAHAVDREYRVITALAGTGVPVPRTHVL